MPGYDPTYSQWCPPEITAAAEPLRRTGKVLRSLSEDTKGLARFGDRGPSPAVQDALSSFLQAWELLLWKVSGEAGSLAFLLRMAAHDYVGSEADLARRLDLDLLAHPDHEGRSR